jgi:exosortase/archaeosortase family protein
LLIIWGCVGFVSMFVFSVILVIIMVEDPSSTKTKVIWSILGVAGTFLVNVFRIVTLFVGFYFYGYEYDKVHLYIGYILFFAWIALFFYLFSKRNVVYQKIRMTFLAHTKR